MLVEARNIDHQRAHFKSLVFWNIFKSLQNTANSSFHPPATLPRPKCKIVFASKWELKKGNQQIRPKKTHNNKISYLTSFHVIKKSQTSTPAPGWSCCHHGAIKGDQISLHLRLLGHEVWSFNYTDTSMIRLWFSPFVFVLIAFHIWIISSQDELKKTCRKKKLTKHIQPVPWPLDERPPKGLSLPAIVVTPHRYWAAHWW